MLTIASVSNAQYVDIEDANFKNALIEEGVDTDKDGEISRNEAEATEELWVFDKNISDMTGIEAFVNINTLECSFNKLTNLDVSKNTALTQLRCSENQLTSLDVSQCTLLESLICQNNSLTSLDVSGCIDLWWLDCNYNQFTSLDVCNNTALEYLGCGHNQLTILDVYNNTALRCLSCSNNQLTSLDVSNNTALSSLRCDSNQLISLNISKNINLPLGGGCCYICGPRIPGRLDLSYMPTLYEVCVWEMPFLPENFDFYVDTIGSPNVQFTTECAVNIPGEYTEKRIIDIYPNPSNDIINIEIENINNATIEI
ncbi:MAG: hypothetical protein JSV22_04230, partial [Bacteroidales bacterium]